MSDPLAHTYCRFGYQYRDASNYKAFEEVVLVGAATDAARSCIEGKLNCDGLFVPEFVGLRPIQSKLDNFPSQDDHIWHEFVYLLPAVNKETRQYSPWGPLSQLVSNFEALAAWESPEMRRRIALLFEDEPYTLFR